MEGYPAKADIVLTSGELEVFDTVVVLMKDYFFEVITACISAKTKIEEMEESSLSITFSKKEMDSLDGAIDGAAIIGDVPEVIDVIKSVHEKIQEQGFTKGESTICLFHETSRLWLSQKERNECVLSLDVHSELTDEIRCLLVSALLRIEPDRCTECKGFCNGGGKYEFTGDELWEIEGALVGFSIRELEEDDMEQLVGDDLPFDSVDEYKQEVADGKSLLKKIRATKKKGEGVKYTDSDFDRRFKGKNS